MSTVLPEVVDAWRMVTARRRFNGSLPLVALQRLCDSLVSTAGEVRFDLQFDRDSLGVAYLHVQAETRLPLTCQRTLDAFEYPVHLDVRLGLIAREADEAALPPGYEPLLCASGELHLADVIEDELILALPLVPVKPGGGEEDVVVWADPEPDDEPEEEAKPNPFAALASLKKH